MRVVCGLCLLCVVCCRLFVACSLFAGRFRCLLLLVGWLRFVVCCLLFDVYRLMCVVCCMLFVVLVYVVRCVMYLFCVCLLLHVCCLVLWWLRFVDCCLFGRCVLSVVRHLLFGFRYASLVAGCLCCVRCLGYL